MAKNPPTKDNLQSEHFKSFGPAIQARLTACLRSDSAHIRPFSPPSEAIEAIKMGLNKVQAKNPPMKRIDDAPNVFGQSMADAVLIYKSNNGIIRVGQPLDNIVGRMTLCCLDNELANQPAPPPPPPVEFGSTSFRFTFFCNRNGIFSLSKQFELFIASTEGQDSGSFKIERPFMFGDINMAFRGETKGFFKTTKKVLVERFGKEASADFTITRISGQLQGAMTIRMGIEDQLAVQFFLPRFKDETFSLTDGSVSGNGELVRR
jgi:hypothetical protein